MERIETIWRLVNTASDLVYENKAYEFNITSPVTFYFDAQHAAVALARWQEPRITIRARLQAGFGWRIATEQDDAGVYVVAKRRTLVGGMAQAKFSVQVPHHTYCILKLQNGALALDDINGTLNIAPPGEDGTIVVE